jgi:hypothetical protein
MLKISENELSCGKSKEVFFPPLKQNIHAFVEVII